MPEKVPRDMLAGFANTIIVPGVVPFAGVVMSHGPPVVVTEKLTGPPLLEMFRPCGRMKMPRWKVNVREDGFADSVPDVVDPVTVRESVVECVNIPEVPVMFTVEVPAAAELLADSVNTLLANVAVTPVGMPEAESATVPVKPFCGVTVTVLVPLALCAIDRLFGESDRLKFGASVVPVTVKLTVAV